MRLIKAGHLYADDTPVEQMREVRCLCVGVWVDVCMGGWVGGVVVMVVVVVC